MKKQKDIYGQLSSIDDAVLIPDDVLQETPETGDDSQNKGNALWLYFHEDKINGIPVAEEDRHLKIDKDELLAAAFMLDRRPKSVVLYMSPEDTESSDKYDELLKREYNGEIIIVDELKQFDMQKGRFIVWVRYDEVRYKLHPRFEYLRED